VKEEIIKDTSILGLGDLEVKDVERVLPSKGRLDLLLRDPDTGTRYEVEIMLGATDESHIIRCIEYWDIEKKRYPQYDHCAVLIAENITWRFRNVISLLNNAIPLIAIKMSLLKVGEHHTLDFNTVLDVMPRGEDDEDEDFAQPADRNYWEDKSSKEAMALSDTCYDMLKTISPIITPKYNRHRISTVDGNRVNNFVVIRPKRNFIKIEVKVEPLDTWFDKLEEVGLTVFESGKKYGLLIFRLTKNELTKNKELIMDLFSTAYGDNKK
jgi:hypothetical protein